MSEIGHTHSLRVSKQVDFGFYLETATLGEVLLPIKYASPNLAVDDIIEVFIYLDSDDRPIATTEVPFAEVGECAYLEVVDVSNIGSFLDWGLSKDLLVPFKEQRVSMEKGRFYSVFIYIDSSNRIAGSSRLNLHLSEMDEDGLFSVHQEVDLLIATRSEMGFRAVINGTHLGLIHNNDIYQLPKLGARVKGYIKSTRDDGRINLSLQPTAPEKQMAVRDELSDRILEYLARHEGWAPLTDKSPPEVIYKAFNVSKANFKKAIGKLYKEKRIVIEKDQIKLV